MAKYESKKLLQLNFQAMNGKGIWRQSMDRLWCNNYINLLEHDRIFCKWRTKSLVAKKIKNKIIISEQILEFKTSKILFWHEYYQEGKIHRSALPMTEILDFLNKDNLEPKLSSIIGGHFGTMIAIFDFFIFHISAAWRDIRLKILNLIDIYTPTYIT